MTHFIALILYLGALVLWLRTLISGERGPPARVASIVAIAGVAAHFVALGQYAQVYGELPLVGLAPSLSTLALITGLGLLSTFKLPEVGGIGLLLLPLIILLEGVAITIGIEPAPDALDFHGVWFTTHVTLAFFGLAASALSAAAGALYLAQHRELKHKRLGRLFRFLPPLADLDRIGRLMATMSLLLLSLALMLGWAWTVSSRSSLQSQDPKVIWAVFIWVVLGGVVVVRRGGRANRERNGARASVVGFGIVVASYIVLRVVLGGGLFL